MNRIPLSPAASGLLRAFIRRAEIARDRILLTDAQSVDWQSLTFVGERHRFELRITGEDSREIADRLSDGLEEAEFSIAGQIVADISVIGRRAHDRDCSTNITIEALTISE